MSEAILFLNVRIADTVGSDQGSSFPEAGFAGWRATSSQGDITPRGPWRKEALCVHRMWRRAVRFADHVSAVLTETSRRMRTLVLRPSGGR